MQELLHRSRPDDAQLRIDRQQNRSHTSDDPVIIDAQPHTECHRHRAGELTRREIERPLRRREVMISCVSNDTDNGMPLFPVTGIAEPESLPDRIDAGPHMTRKCIADNRCPTILRRILAVERAAACDPHAECREVVRSDDLQVDGRICCPTRRRL